MKKRKVLIILLLLIISISCRNKGDKGIVKINKINYSLNKIKNPFSEITEYRYIDYSKTNDNDILIYNEYSFELEFYNLQESKLISILKLDSLISKYGSLNSLYYYNNDKIFLLFETALILYNNKGYINDSYTTEINYNSKKYFISNTAYFNMTYNPKENKLFLPIYSFDFPFSSKEFFQEPICAVYNLSNKSFSFTKACFSNLYKNKYFGLANFISHTNDNNYLHYFNFPADDNILVYDDNRGETKIINCKSKYKESDCKDIEFNTSLSDRKSYDCLVLNPLYDNFIYDPYKNFFYRFFYKELELKDSKGMYNTFNDKELYLMILDKNLNIISEFLLPKDKFNISVCIPTQKGLLISSSHFKNKEHDKKYFSFYIISFN